MCGFWQAFIKQSKKRHTVQSIITTPWLAQFVTRDPAPPNWWLEGELVSLLVEMIVSLAGHLPQTSEFPEAIEREKQIRQEKANGINTVKRVWKCYLNYHKIHWTFPWISPGTIDGFRSWIHKTMIQQWFNQNTSKLVFKKKKSNCASLGNRMKYSYSCFI